MQSKRRRDGDARSPREEPALTPIGRCDGPRATWCTADARDTLRRLEDGSVDAAVVTPPGFWHRRAPVPGAIGNEPSIDNYVERVGSVFEELRRVLRPNGTAWLAIGDSAYSGRGGRREQAGRFHRLLDRAGGLGGSVQRKSLLGIPWRVAGVVAGQGWSVRAAIQWIRPPMVPNTARDRPARIVEPVFLLARHRRYRYRPTRWRSDPAPDVWLIRSLGRGSVRRDKLALVRRCLQLSDIGDEHVVIDPFAGHGETLAAANERHAHAIGIDIDPKAREAAVATVGRAHQLPLDDDPRVEGEDPEPKPAPPQPRLAAAG